MTYPPPPPPQGPQGKPARLRGHTGIRVGAILAIVGLVMVIGGAIVGFSAGLKQVSNFQRVSLSDGTGSLSFDTGDYVAYYEAPGFNENGSTVPIILLQLRNKATGAGVTGNLYGNRSDGNKVDRLTYSYDGHNGAALYEFTIKTAGQYTATLQASQGSNAAPDSDLAFGKSIATGLAVGGVVAVVGFLLLLAGIIVLIVGLVRRRRHKKQLLASAGYGGYGGAAAYPPPGYGPQYAPGQPQGQGYGQQYPQGQPQGQGYGQQYPPPGAQSNQQPNPQQYQSDQSGQQQPPSLRKDEHGDDNPWPPRD